MVLVGGVDIESEDEMVFYVRSWNIEWEWEVICVTFVTDNVFGMVFDLRIDTED